MTVGAASLRQLRLMAELLDQGGNVVAQSSEVEPVAGRDPVHLPGDSAAFRVLIFEQRKAPAAVRARVRVLQIRESPWEGEVDRGTPVLIDRLERMPANVDIEIRERSVSIGTGGLMDEDAAQLAVVFELANVGALAISELELEVRPLGADGEALPVARSSLLEGIAQSGVGSAAAGIVRVVRSSDPVLRPRGRLVMKATVLVPDAQPEIIRDYRMALRSILP